MDEVEEFKGRINILEQQRNDALNQNVILGGQVNIYLKKIEKMQFNIDNLECGNLLEDCLDGDDESSHDVGVD